MPILPRPLGVARSNQICMKQKTIVSIPAIPYVLQILMSNDHRNRRNYHFFKAGQLCQFLLLSHLVENVRVQCSKS